ncbi:MAG: hypothetical protein JJE49_09050 [Peptostreptococcaceae bacterium]|nr:hypothetical protein [Peptostreptococcaceae bacterium]
MMDKSEELIAANLVIPIIKDLVLPKVQSVINKFFKKNIDAEIIEASFQKYLSQRYEKFLIIDTLGACRAYLLQI